MFFFAQFIKFLWRVTAQVRAEMKSILWIQNFQKKDELYRKGTFKDELKVLVEKIWNSGFQIRRYPEYRENQARNPVPR